MAGTWIKNKNHIEVIQAVLERKIKDTGRKTTPACMILCKPLKLSHLTLINILNGSVSVRTRERMIHAGWFTRADLDRAQSYHTKTSNDTGSASSARATNDAQQQASREKEAYSRGFADGYSEGYNKAHKRTKKAHDAAYNEGFKDGRASGGGRSKSRSKPKTDDAGLPVDKLQSLFNMNTDRGAAQGETVAARVAVGKVLSRWIKNKFGHTVEVKLS